MSNYYKAILQHDYPVNIEPSETSYFSGIASGLDPTLFHGDKLIPSIRNSILSLLFGALSKFQNADVWTHAWLAGSGVSYHWAAHRDPADLDCLIGIDYNKFRQTNVAYRGLSDREIAAEVNETLSNDLHPQTSNYLGVFDLTFYANVKSNIIDIKPYAAYSLTDDRWVVEPKKENIKRRPEWDVAIHQDIERAYEITDRYKQSLTQFKAAPHDAARRNAEVGLVNATKQGAALYDEIHGGRKQAFSPTGEGYEDFYNYRWQSGKASGIIQALKKLKDASTNLFSTNSEVDLPTADVLIRRAALQYKGMNT